MRTGSNPARCRASTWASGSPPMASRMVGRSIALPYAIIRGESGDVGHHRPAEGRAGQWDSGRLGATPKVLPPMRSGAASHPHAALRAVERAGAPGLVAAVRAGQAGTATDRRKPRLLRLAEAVAGGDHLLVQRAEKLVADALGVTAKALPAPPDDGTDDELTRELVPVRGEAADDGVVPRVAAGIDLAVQQAAEEGVDGHVERIGHLEHVQPVAS